MKGAARVQMTRRGAADPSPYSTRVHSSGMARKAAPAGSAKSTVVAMALSL